MRFGAIPVRDAEGAILAHSVKAGDQRLRKGITLNSSHIELLTRADIGSVVVARLEPEDVEEDHAAECLADVLRVEGLDLSSPVAGRCNLVATGTVSG